MIFSTLIIRLFIREYNSVNIGLSVYLWNLDDRGLQVLFKSRDLICMGNITPAVLELIPKLKMIYTELGDEY